MPAAPLWDSTARQFVGLMSVTDFIDILRHYHRRGIAMDELSAQSIGHVMSDADGRRLQHSIFIGTTVTTNIMDACHMLQRNNHRFLPVIPPVDSRVLSILSYYDVLRYLVDHFREQRRLFEDAVADLGIGTYGEKCITTKASTRLVDVLDLLETHDISAVPVVDETGRVIDLYSRSDITFLATATDAESVISNLDMTIQQVLELRQGEVDTKERLHKCNARSSLQSIFELFADVGFHRLVCVDESDRCVGVISVRDLIVYFSTGKDEDHY
jgi:5'-AMP-activated protein kinase regulatory gamma subunit